MDLLPAGRVDRRSGDVATLLRSEEQDEIGDVLGLLEASERNLRQDRRPQLVDRLAGELRVRFPEAAAQTEERRLHRAGADGVDRDLVPTELLRRDLGEADDREFGRAVRAE